jgi:putative spermidine/putrescine transport system permease protein
MSRSQGALLLAAPALALLLAFLALPYADMVVMSFRNPGHGEVYGPGFTLTNFSRALTGPIYLAALGRTLLLGAVVTVGCLVLSYPVAMHLAGAGRRSHLVFYAIVVSPLLLGVLVRNFGWLIVLSPEGPLSRLGLALGLIAIPLRLLFTPGAVVLALVHVFLPFMVLPITGALRATPRELADASGSLGAGWWHTFWHVTLPLSFPGVQAGVILVFVLACSAYVTPALIGGQGGGLMPLLLVQALVGSFAWPFGAALALVMAVAMLACVLLFALATRRLARRTSR